MLLALLLACAADPTKGGALLPTTDGGHADTAEAPDTGAGDTADTADSAEPADTADPEDTAPTGETGEAASPIVLDGDCPGVDDQWTAWTAPEWSEPEVHVVTVYDARSVDPDDFELTVTRGTDMILVLASYEDVTWNVTLGPDTDVNTIVVSSYEGARVSFTTGVTAPIRDFYFDACAFETPDTTRDDCETSDLMREVEAFTRLPIASLQACYGGGEFWIE